MGNQCINFNIEQKPSFYIPFVIAMCACINYSNLVGSFLQQYYQLAKDTCVSNEEILANTVAVTLFKITTQVAKLHIHYCKDKTTWSDMGFLIIEMWEFGEHTNTHTHSHTNVCFL